MQKLQSLPKNRNSTKHRKYLIDNKKSHQQFLENMMRIIPSKIYSKIFCHLRNFPTKYRIITS